MVDFDVRVKLEAGSAQAQLRQMEQGLQNVERAAGGGQRGFDLFGSAITGAMTALSTAAINAATTAIQGLGMAVVGSVQTFQQFESSMNNVAALTGATGAEFDSLEKKARELGASTRYSASEVADAMGFLGMAGFETNEILASTQTMLDLAAAGQLDLAQAADIASNVMGQFGIAASDADRVTNLLAATAASANTNVSQLSEAMVYLGPTAKSLGISIEETAAIIGVLGDAGIQGSMAGRALGTSLVRLTDPTDKMAAAISELNLEIADSNGSFVSFEELLRQIETGLEGYTDTQKAATLTALLGAEAYQEINILLERGSEAFGEYTESITGTNKAQEIAEIQTRGLEGSMLALNSASEELQITMGEALAPALVAAADKASEVILALVGQETASNDLQSASEQLAEAIESIDAKELANDISNAMEATLGFLEAVGKIIAKLAEWNTSIRNMIPGLQGLSSVMGFVYERTIGDSSEARRARLGMPTTNGPRSDAAFQAFATGGIIDKPTLALMGEAGMNEAVVPLPDGRSIPVDIRGGGELTFDAPKMAQAIAQALQGVYVEGNIGPTSTGEHFDIKRTDRSYFEREMLDAYVRVNGRPLSSGVTVPGGRFGAPRPYGKHAGWDYAFGAGRHELSLMNGAEWVSNQPGTSNGDLATFRTPDGKMYQILHGRFEGGRLPRTPGAMAGMTGTGAEEPMLTNPLAVGLGTDPLGAMKIVGEFNREQALARYEQANQRLQDQVELIERRLELSGMEEEAIRNILELEQQDRDAKRAIAELQEDLEIDKLKGLITEDDVQQQIAERITLEERYKLALMDRQEAERQAAEYQKETIRLFGEAEEEMRLIEESQARSREYVDQLTGAFTNLAVNVLSGAQSMTQAIGQFFNTILSYLANQAFQSLFSGLFGNLFGLGGGGGLAVSLNNPPLAIPGFATGGIVDRPTLAMVGEGGMSEAVVPLPDGRRIPVQMQGGGAGTITNITVNVTSNGGETDGRRLGRQISEAIKAELVQQRRVGGLLR